jgi:hypothetical protein
MVGAIPFGTVGKTPDFLVKRGCETLSSNDSPVPSRNRATVLVGSDSEQQSAQLIRVSKSVREKKKTGE